MHAEDGLRPPIRRGTLWALFTKGVMPVLGHRSVYVARSHIGRWHLPTLLPPKDHAMTHVADEGLRTASLYLAAPIWTPPLSSPGQVTHHRHPPLQHHQWSPPSIRARGHQATWSSSLAPTKASTTTHGLARPHLSPDSKPPRLHCHCLAAAARRSHLRSRHRHQSNHNDPHLFTTSGPTSPPRSSPHRWGHTCEG
jgi:hypothetical protein